LKKILDNYDLILNDLDIDFILKWKKENEQERWKEKKNEVAKKKIEIAKEKKKSMWCE
jgi:hypothetical protein